MVSIKRVRSEVECEFCGKKFMQTRWWQVFCSRGCKKTVERTAKSEVKRLTDEVRFLRSEVERLSRNALVHSGTRKYVQEPFKYDNENQDVHVGE